MANLIIILAAIALLICLLYFEKTEGRLTRLIVKVALSSLFIVAAVTQLHPRPDYYTWLLIGLAFCLIGDGLLAVPAQRAFKAGLFAFLGGHVFYIAAFGALTPVSQWLGVQTLLVVVVSIVAFIWLRAHVGSMLAPVVLYLVVISVMTIAALSVWRAHSAGGSGAIMVGAGAVCFYVSDLFVARDRFVRNEFLNRVVGLPLYYGGQFLLAFSVGCLE